MELYLLVLNPLSDTFRLYWLKIICIGFELKNYSKWMIGICRGFLLFIGGTNSDLYLIFNQHCHCLLYDIITHQPILAVPYT